jgi:tetratricopeptide (TPR) repeat protein
MAKRAKPGASSAGSGSRLQKASAPTSGREQDVTRPKPPASPVGPPAEATHLLEQGMVALQRHDYARAGGIFQQMLREFPLEGAVADRARVYLGLCERELAARPEMPQSMEERLTAATAALNDGKDDRAEQLVRFVLAENPEHDLALYLLAAVEARRGMAAAALQYLSQAVAVSPEAGAQARHDPDFALLRGTEQFEELTEPPPAPADSKPRRRRTRAER